MRDPAAPFVTYYDCSTSERVELSWTTFDNWVCKTANLLRDEIGVGVGANINLRLPLHWIQPVWVAAAWRIGATIQLGVETDLPDVVVIGPGLLSDAVVASAPEVVACSLAPMAQGFGKPLPAPAIDYFTEVRAHGDQFSGGPIADPERTVLIADRRTWTSPGLQLAATQQASAWRLPTPGRLLVNVGEHTGQEADSVAALLAGYAIAADTDGSVVIVRHAEPADLTRISSQERTTGRVDLN